MEMILKILSVSVLTFNRMILLLLEVMDFLIISLLTKYWLLFKMLFSLHMRKSFNFRSYLHSKLLKEVKMIRLALHLLKELKILGLILLEESQMIQQSSQQGFRSHTKKYKKVQMMKVFDFNRKYFSNLFYKKYLSFIYFLIKNVLDITIDL